jgi:hypothetical protein
MTPTEQAEKIVRDLEEELEGLNGRTSILSKQHQELSFAARAGDKSARTKLNATNVEISTNTSEIEIVTAALVEAKSRLGTAEQVATRAADIKKAEQIQELQAAFVDRLQTIDEACEDIARCTSENKVLLSEMHRLGITHPSHDQVRINSVLALKTMLMGCPWNTHEYAEYPHVLAPNERKYFKSLAEAWGATITRQIADRLPVDQKDAA